ncbi:MAG: Ig-like domain-containing protein, partial [Clostridia bacterium]
NNAHLKSLQLSKGKLSPGFNRKGTEYTANVDHSVETIIITPTAYEPTASISLRVNHDPAESASSGQASSPHALAVGANEVVVSVKTEDAFKTYNITVNREADDQVPVTGIELDQNKLEMQVDSKPVLLKATITPEDATNKNVTWSSSNPKAVQVDQKGLVTPLAPGESTIRVTTEDGEKTAECLVIVKEKGSEPSVVGLEAKEESFLLKPKKSVSIKVYARYDNGTKKEITRDKKTVYESSAPSIAKIEKGVIKAGSKEGEAEITVVYQGQTQTIKVMVSKATVTKLKPSDTKMTLKPGDTNQLFVNASFTDKSDKDVTNLAKWQSSNANVVTVVAGQITAVGKGKATIKATFGGKTTVISITVKEGTTPNP